MPREDMRFDDMVVMHQNQTVSLLRNLLTSQALKARPSPTANIDAKRFKARALEPDAKSGAVVGERHERVDALRGHGQGQSGPDHHSPHCTAGLAQQTTAGTRRRQR